MKKNLFNFLTGAAILLAANSLLAEDGWVQLFDGETLKGWTQKGGNAPYKVEDGCIVGTTVIKTGNSFLCTSKNYSDFIFEYEYLVHPEMNSGVQVRSHCFATPQTYTYGGKSWKVPANRVHGYQIEIDPSKRAWSCGIYDEGRSGWLYDLKDKPEAQSAFKQNEWNKVRVEARGDRMRTWLNGIPVADLTHSLDSDGFIALQVHGIGNNEGAAGREIRWKNLQIKELKRETHEAGVGLARGAWTWFNDPRAIVRKNMLYSGYVRVDGAVCVGAYNIENKTVTETVLSAWRERDDHDNIGFLEMSDGRFAAFYTRHGNDSKMTMRFAGSKTPLTIEDWGDEVVTDWSNLKLRGGACYNNPFKLSNEPNRIYDFIRGINWNPSLVLSDDNGMTWGNPIHLIFHKDRPYTRFASNGRDRIDILYTDGHPRMVDNSVYHVAIVGGCLVKSDGEQLGEIGKMDPIPTTSGSVVYQFGSAYPGEEKTRNGRAWIWDISYLPGEIPQVIHTVKVTEGDIRYFYASWSNEEKKWSSHEIARAGAPLYKSEEDYVGGATFDPEHPDRIYISSEFSPITGAQTPRREIYCGTTADAGVTWAWKAVTAQSEFDNLRPYVPRKHGKEECLLWFTGVYNAYQDFDTTVRAKIY